MSKAVFELALTIVDAVEKTSPIANHVNQQIRVGGHYKNLIPLKVFLSNTMQQYFVCSYCLFRSLDGPFGPSRVVWNSGHGSSSNLSVH